MVSVATEWWPPPPAVGGEGGGVLTPCLYLSQSLFLKAITLTTSHSEERNRELKGQCHEIFDLYFFHKSNPSGLLINRLKYDIQI